MKSKKDTKRCLEMGSFLGLMLLLMASILGAQMASENYEIRCSSLNSGGGQTSSATFEMQSSFGQATPTGTSESATYGLHAGILPITFWVVPSPCIEFEDLTLGHSYNVGNTITTSDVEIKVGQYQWEDGTWFYLGSALVSDGKEACRSGKEMAINNVNLKFNFEEPLPKLCLNFSKSGNNVNVKINRDFMNLSSFYDIDGSTIDGVDVSVRGSGDDGGCGIFELSGAIDSCAVGGEELCIDHVCLGEGHNCEIPVVLRGDVTGDLNIDILDVLAVVNHILGVDELTGDALMCADCNCDGTCNILDCIGIVNVILGIGECEPGACKTELTDEALEFFKALQPQFPAEEFEKLMSLVKPEVQVPTEYSLAQNYPNPFNPRTDIRYQIPDVRSPVHTTLKIYNILGQEVRTLVDEVEEPGYYTVTWNGKDSVGSQVASGVYFIRLTAGDFSATRRMVLMK